MDSEKTINRAVRDAAENQDTALRVRSSTAVIKRQADVAKDAQRAVDLLAGEYCALVARLMIGERPKLELLSALKEVGRLDKDLAEATAELEILRPAVGFAHHLPGCLWNDMNEAGSCDCGFDEFKISVAPEGS